MSEELRADLERYGRVETDLVTWVHPCYNYWHCYCGWEKRDEIIAEMSAKYPDYKFGRGECHINNRIYYVINIYKNKQSNEDKRPAR